MTFISGPGWQQSSEPHVARKVHLENDAGDTYYLWPVGDTNWDTLNDGEHPVLAIGRKANRPRNITGVVVTYDAATETATFNLADKAIVKAYVANIASYNFWGDVATWQNTIYPGDPVYVDDSTHVYALDDGCTLSFSERSNDKVASPNPLAGYVWWCQDEFKDSEIGGSHSTQGISQPVAPDTTEMMTLCVQLVNDHGRGTPLVP